MTEVKKGRPPKAQEDESSNKHTGSLENFSKKPASWKRAHRLDVEQPEDGSRYYWSRQDQVNRRKEQGWEVVKDHTGNFAKGMHLADSNENDGTVRRGELILMWLPDKLSQERDAAMEEEVRSQMGRGKSQAEQAYNVKLDEHSIKQETYETS